MLTRFLLFLVLFSSIGIINAQGTVENTRCLERPFGYVTNCGYVTLPQDYANPDTLDVEIYYSQTFTHSEFPQPDPLVYLVGGPGSSGSQLLQSSFRAYLQAFAADRDIIVIDQRGTGLSNPSLYCQEIIFRITDVLESRQDTHADTMLDILSDCYDRLSANGIALETFHSANNARDVTNVLLSLGYEEWNLVGVSYGSRLALTMMRDYPQYIRSVILDSVYPLQADLYVDSYYNGERALAVLFEACAIDSDCNERYPDLATIFYDLYNRLNETPLEVTFSPPRIRTLDIELSGYRLYDWVFTWLYSVDSIESIPRIVYELDAGQYNFAIRYGTLYESAVTALSLGMHYTVQCQEEFISDPNRDYSALVETYPHLDGYLSYPVEGAKTVARLCDTWQTVARDEVANTAVDSDIPTLLLSGNFDPITPPDYANLANETLNQSYNYVLPYVGHGVLRSDDCAIQIAVDFINNPMTEPDVSCIDETQPIRFD